MDPDTRVRAALLDQAEWCDRLGSPFTALLCRVFAQELRPDSSLGRRVLSWSGDPTGQADSVALRMTGALHALARSGRCAALAQLYPPASLPAPGQLWTVIAPLLDVEQAHFDRFLDRPPQTNEVGRSAVLLPGLLWLARQVQLPLALYEIGASAGLNLNLDRYHYRFGSRAWGDAGAELTLTPQWRGCELPADLNLRIAARAGCDAHPLNLSDAAERERLLASVWPDQAERLANLQAALRVATRHPVLVERADAADWLTRQVRHDAPAGVARVALHSIVWGDLTPQTRPGVLEYSGWQVRPLYCRFDWEKPLIIN